MYFQSTIPISLIICLSLNLKTSQVVAIIGDDDNLHKNWECALLIKHNEKFICSATLVVDDNGVQFVLTSAKCLWNGSNKLTSHYPADHLYVYGWTNHFNAWKGELRLVKKLVLHSEFDPRYWTHDIAVIFLNEPFHEKEGEFQACNLPPPENKISGGLLMMGFGTQNIEKETTGRLGKVTMPYINQNVCKSFGKYSDAQFCLGWLGKGGIGPCFGDEGNLKILRLDL